MQDAVNALESAIDELTTARGTLPHDIAPTVDGVIAQAQSVLENQRTKAPANA